MKKHIQIDFKDFIGKNHPDPDSLMLKNFEQMCLLAEEYYKYKKSIIMKKYIQGMNMKNLKHIPEISHYNYNYYVGIDKDLLLAVSDDDNITEWFLSQHERFDKIGESYTSEGEKLHLKTK